MALNLLILLVSLLMLTPSVALGAGSSIKNASGRKPQQISKVAPTPEAQQSLASETWRKKPPVLPSPRSFKLPETTSFQLTNGLKVELVEDHRVPFITADLGIKAGSTKEPTELLGLADLTAEMLSQGTVTKNSKEIADEIDFIGGAISANSDYDNTVIGCSALSKYADRLITSLAEVVLQPTFPDDELSLKKTNLIQELSMKRSEPDFLLDERFSRVTFGNHPYAVVAPTPETVAKITRKDIEDFHKQHYLPNEGYLVVVGDFDSAKMKQLIADKFEKDWASAKMPSEQKAAMPDQHGRKIYLVDRPGSVQSSIKLGNVSIKKTDPDYMPMIVCNQILGGAGNARLFLNIREAKGYTYGAYSGVGARREPGAFACEAEVRTDVTSPSLQEFLYELERLRNVKVTDKELSSAKAYLAGSFQLGLETQAGLAQRLLEEKLYDLPDNYLETYVERLMKVTTDDIRLVARRHIDLDNIIICVVGDAGKIKSDLEYFAPVDVYDKAGKLSSSPAASVPGS